MSHLLLLSERQMARIEAHFPLAHAVPRVDDRRVVSGEPKQEGAVSLRQGALQKAPLRRIATRYDRCAHTFFSRICIAATVIFWL